MKSEFEIAMILKPRGLKGEMKVEFYSSDTARFSNLKEVRISGVAHAVEKLSAEGDYGYIKLADVNCVEDAEKLRGLMVCASRDSLPALEGGKQYIADMIGLDVQVSGNIIGKLSDILQYGSADVYVVRTTAGSLSFPALKQLIKKVDIKSGVIVLDEVVFDRVVVYN